MKMNYPIVLGTDDIASKFGGLIGLPTTVVITRDGKIAKRFIGLANRDNSKNRFARCSNCARRRPLLALARASAVTSKSHVREASQKAYG